MLVQKYAHVYMYIWCACTCHWNICYVYVGRGGRGTLIKKWETMAPHMHRKVDREHITAYLSYPMHLLNTIIFSPWYSGKTELAPRGFETPILTGALAASAASARAWTTSQENWLKMCLKCEHVWGQTQKSMVTCCTWPSSFLFIFSPAWHEPTNYMSH